MKKYSYVLLAAFVAAFSFVGKASADDEIISLTADMFYTWDGYGADASQLAQATVDFNVGNDVTIDAGGMVAGTSTVEYLTYADLTGSTKLIFEGTSGMSIRVLMNRQESNTGPLEERTCTIDTQGKAEISLEGLSYVHINAIKTGWLSVSGTISSVKFVKPSDPLSIPKGLLKTVIDAAKMYTPYAKTPKSWDKLQKAITDGESMLKDADATEETLQDARIDIVVAIDSLTLQNGYRTLSLSMFESHTAQGEEGTQTNCAYDLFTSSGLPYGDGNVSWLNYADLSAYDKLIVTAAAGTPRFCLNRTADGAQDNDDPATSQFIDIPGHQWGTDAYQTMDGDKVWVIDLKKLVADRGIAYLHSIKGANFANVIVTDMLLYSEIMKEAQDLADDGNAVAVGKLRKAITDVMDGGDLAALQAAIDQFKADNADQESDQTAKVAVDWQKWTGATGFATWAAPQVTTYDGRTTYVVENYNGGSGAVTGEIFSQTITGLLPGDYKVAFFANANSTADRDAAVETGMADGADDVAYVFANDAKEFIVAHRATSITENGEYAFEMTLTDADNGTIKLGLGKEKAGTNWHTMQIKQLTWFTTAKAVYALRQTDLSEALAVAQALCDDMNKTNGREAFEDAILAAQAAVGSDMLNIAELEAIIADLNKAIANFEQQNYWIPSEAVVAYIIDAESGLMMAAGNDYGTRAMVNETGLDLIITPNEESRTVTINTRVSNGGNDHFLGSNLYMDAPVKAWALEYQGFGFYIIDPVTKQYINISSANNLEMSNTPREFIIVTAEGVMEERLAELEEASELNPVDATFLLKSPNFNRNDQRTYEAWTISDDCTNSNLNGGNQVNNCAESFHSTFTISQIVEGAPAGRYTMTAQGFFRQDDGEEEPAPVFFVNGKTTEVLPLTGEENSMSAASQSFSAGLYTIQPLKFTVGADGKIELGVRTAATHQWVIFDNFQLTYLGPVTLPTNLAEAIELLESQIQDAYELLDSSSDKTVDEQNALAEAIGNAETVLSAAKEGNATLDEVNAAYQALSDAMDQFANGTITGIATVKAASAANEAFTVSGQRVSTLKKGLYIVNGKKVVVK